ncbi:MAG: hypothetical protein JO207_06615 [Verrucomicrobia bacterium]|nr:hypothetical protein [Verrucomicrobiota bacterium]
MGVQESGVQEFRSRSCRSSGVQGDRREEKKLPDSSKRIKLYAVQDGKKKSHHLGPEACFFILQLLNS